MRNLLKKDEKFTQKRWEIYSKKLITKFVIPLVIPLVIIQKVINVYPKKYGVSIKNSEIEQLKKCTWQGLS